MIIFGEHQDTSVYKQDYHPMWYTYPEERPTVLGTWWRIQTMRTKSVYGQYVQSCDFPDWAWWFPAGIPEITRDMQDKSILWFQPVAADKRDEVMRMLKNWGAE